MDSSRRQWERWFPEDRDGGKPPAKSGWTAGKVLLALTGVLALFIVLSVVKGFYTEWLWFDHLGYSSVFTTILWTRILIFFLAVIIFALLFLGN